MYMIAIHPVLQYCYVIARDLPVIGVIVRKIGGLQESWWISRANTFTGMVNIRIARLRNALWRASLRRATLSTSYIRIARPNYSVFLQNMKPLVRY